MKRSYLLMPALLLYSIGSPLHAQDDPPLDSPQCANLLLPLHTLVPTSELGPVSEKLSTVSRSRNLRLVRDYPTPGTNQVVGLRLVENNKAIIGNINLLLTGPIEKHGLGNASIAPNGHLIGFTNVHGEPDPNDDISHHIHRTISVLSIENRSNPTVIFQDTEKFTHTRNTDPGEGNGPFGYHYLPQWIETQEGLFLAVLTVGFLNKVVEVTTFPITRTSNSYLIGSPEHHLVDPKIDVLTFGKTEFQIFGDSFTFSRNHPLVPRVRETDSTERVIVSKFGSPMLANLFRHPLLNEGWNIAANNVVFFPKSDDTLSDHTLDDFTVEISPDLIKSDKSIFITYPSSPYGDSSLTIRIPGQTHRFFVWENSSPASLNQHSIPRPEGFPFIYFADLKSDSYSKRRLPVKGQEHIEGVTLDNVIGSMIVQTSQGNLIFIALNTKQILVIDAKAGEIKQTIAMPKGTGQITELDFYIESNQLIVGDEYGVYTELDYQW